MTREAKLSSKGQVTIPRDIRRLLGVNTGDKLQFESGRDGRVRITPVRSEDPFVKYQGIGNPGIPSGRKAIVRWLRDLRGR